MNVRETRSVALNVFEHFRPHLPEAYRQTPYVLLANIAPSLQSYVLDQMARARFIVADTMDLWITIAKDDLMALLKRVDLLILNDSEAKLLTGETNLIRAAEMPSAVTARVTWRSRRANTAACCSAIPAKQEFFSCPAFPLANLHDPTGAGDCFAGGLIGQLSQKDTPQVSFEQLREAVVYGSVVASYNVEAFSLERLRSLQFSDVETRFAEFRRISQF